MQGALSHKSWSPPQSSVVVNKVTHNHCLINTSLSTKSLEKQKDYNSISKIISENALIVFRRRGCCMCHVVERLFHGLGANPAIYELQEDDMAKTLVEQLENNNSGSGRILQLPKVFIGGKLYGGLDSIIAMHISDELVPVLKQAGALWL